MVGISNRNRVDSSLVCGIFVKPFRFLWKNKAVGVLFFASLIAGVCFLATVNRCDASSGRILLQEGVSQKEEVALGFADNVKLQHGQQRVCPCCGWTGHVFDNVPSHSHRPDGLCPSCRALERHRVSCAFLGTHSPDIFNVTLQEPGAKQSNMFRLIHFGPHQQMGNVLDKAWIDHIWVDFKPEMYNHGGSSVTKTLFADASDLKLPDNFAHGMLMFHVLEHVPELEQALLEMKRVLKPQGWLLLEVPLRHATETRDCRNLETDQARIDCAGQYDHVWNFGRKDFEHRLQEAGWNCADASNRIRGKVEASVYDSFQLKTNGVQVPQYFCRPKKS